MLILATTVGLADVDTDSMFTDAVLIKSIVVSCHLSQPLFLFLLMTGGQYRGCAHTS